MSSGNFNNVKYHGEVNGHNFA